MIFKLYCSEKLIWKRKETSTHDVLGVLKKEEFDNLITSRAVDKLLKDFREPTNAYKNKDMELRKYSLLLRFALFLNPLIHLIENIRLYKFL